MDEFIESREEMEAILREINFGFLGMSVDGAPYVVPLNHAYVDGKILFHCALEGKKLDEIYRQSEGSKGFTFVLLMRLIPVLPWEIQNYVAGLTKVSPPTFIAGTMLGIIPGSFSLVFLGDAVTDPTSWQFFAAVALKIATALIPVVAIYIRSRRSRRRQAPQAD